MDDSARISIIVPVYNVEKCLEQCLDSIINQTLSKIEIICINDGSTDNSLRILEEYAQKDERLIIINKENGGLGAARNTGLEYVNGEYIGFVDSDDWIEPEMFEKLYSNAKTHDSDIVMCSAYLYDDIIKELDDKHPYFSLEVFGEDFEDIVFNCNQTENFLFDISVTAWNKIYKTKFINETKSKFPENLIFEDNPFFYETYLKAKKVSLLKEHLYFYRINRTDSIIKKAGKRFFDIIKINDLIKAVFIDTHNFDKYKKNLFNHIIASTIFRFHQVDDKYKQEFLELIKQNFKELNLKAEDFDELSANTKSKYENIMEATYYREFELLEEISWLKSHHTNELSRYERDLKAQKQILSSIISSNSWKLTHPMRKVGSGLKRLKKKK